MNLPLVLFFAYFHRFIVFYLLCLLSTDNTTQVEYRMTIFYEQRVAVVKI